MKYLVNRVADIIIKESDKNDGKSIFRIDSFDSIKTYEQIANTIAQHYASTNVELIIKLSRERFEDFSNSQKDQVYITSMVENGWIADKPLTELRNTIPTQGRQLIIVLMGTEAVEDKGGLHDFFQIDLGTLERSLNGHFHKLFNESENLTKEETSTIDILCSSLFEYVPVDLQVLSQLSDEIGIIEYIDDFFVFFFSNLSRFGLLNQQIDIPTIDTVLSKRYKELIKQNYQFINRKLDLTNSKSKYNNFIKKLEEFEKSNDYEEFITQLQEAGIEYTAFKQIVIEYLIGENININRNKLKKIDLYFVLKLLGLKLTTPTPTVKDKTVHLYGNPLNVFTYIVLNELANANRKFDRLNITVQHITLVDEKLERVEDEYCDFNANESSLLNTFKSLCSATNGIIQHISNFNFDTSMNDEYEISLYPVNIFNKECAGSHIDNKTVTEAGAGKLKNKIEFVVSLFENGSDKAFNTQKYDWTFLNSESWRYNFSELLFMKQSMEHVGEAFLPISTIEKSSMMEGVFSDTEFYDSYSEINLEHNNIFKNLSDIFDNNQEWKGLFLNLAKSFVSFVCAYESKGFYNSRDEVNSYLQSYQVLGNKILETSFTEQQQWIVRTFISLFSIQDSIDAIVSNEDVSSVLIPPWHPATLQKIIHKETFMLDGIHEWWNDGNSRNMSKFSNIVYELDNQSKITLGIDTFPTKHDKCMVLKKCFGDFFYYNNIEHKVDVNIRAKDIVKKEAVFDDKFSEKEYSTIDANAKMILDVMNDYVKAFPQRMYELNLTFINPSDLQPIIAAVHTYISSAKKQGANDNQINMKIHLIVSPENRGGKTYLLYWLNTFFSNEENVNVEVYIKQWDNKDETDSIGKIVPDMNDIIFRLDLLKSNTINIDEANVISDKKISNCKFPIIYVPAPHSKSSAKRKIEITQNQFEISTLHSDLIFHLFNLQKTNKRALVSKTIEIDSAAKEAIKDLHDKSYWVACIDSGIDGGLLRGPNTEDYAIIGYATGKGNNGEKNITITAKNGILNQIENNMKLRVLKLFRCSDEIASQIAKNAMNKAAKMDGLSILKAINFSDCNIHEFLGYMLALEYSKSQNSDYLFSTIIHLDSYKHWFNDDSRATKSRPDFLLVNISNDNGNLKLEMNILESKLAATALAEGHVDKALTQVVEGEFVLSSLFAPEDQNSSIKRRYWYAQLFRAISFAQITHLDNSQKFEEISTLLCNVLDGNYEITWEKTVLGFWKDSNETDIKIVDTDDIRVHNIPQRHIYKLLTSESELEVAYIDIAKEETDYDRVEELDIVEDIDVDEKTPTTIVDDNNDTNKVEEHKPNDVIGPRNIPDRIADEVSKAVDIDLENIKVLLGKTKKTCQSVSWDFGDKKLSNRHVLITGSSGQGKTYLMQTMLSDLVKSDISSIIFDYTEGFRRNMLEDEFHAIVGDQFKEHIVYIEGLPINPFRRHKIDVAGMEMNENISDVANRLADILKNVYAFGDQQYSAIYSACKAGMEKYGEAMSMQKFADELAEANSTYARTVLAKITPFIDAVKFDTSENFDWDQFQEEAQIFVFQLTNYGKEMQVIMTELMLWDAWFHKKITGNKDKPFVVVLDEAQNLSHKDGSPTQKILTEGRKFGWSAWFATQFLKQQLNDAEINRLQQAALSIYFKPSDNDITYTAKMLGDATKYKQDLQLLQRGACIVTSNIMPTPKVINVTSFNERMANDGES